MPEPNAQTKQMYELLKKQNSKQWTELRDQLDELLKQGDIDWDYIPDDGSIHYILGMALGRTAGRATIQAIHQSGWWPSAAHLAEYEEAAKDRMPGTRVARLAAPNQLLRLSCKWAEEGMFAQVVNGLQALPEAYRPNMLNAYHYLLDDEAGLIRDTLSAKWGILEANGIKAEEAMKPESFPNGYPTGASLLGLLASAKFFPNNNERDNVSKRSKILKHFMDDGSIRVEFANNNSGLKVIGPDGHEVNFEKQFTDDMAEHLLKLRCDIIEGFGSFEKKHGLDVSDYRRKLRQCDWAERPVKLTKPIEEFTTDDMKAAYASDSMQYIMHPEIWAGHEAHGLALMHELPKHITDHMLEHGHQWMTPAMIIETQSILPEGKCRNWSAKLAA